MAERIKKYPDSLQTAILLRAIGDKGFESLYEQYKGARKSREATPPNEKQIRLANLAVKFGMNKAASMAGVSAYKVDYALSRVGAWHYRHKN